MNRYKLLPRSIIAVLIITIIPYFILALFAHPSADDFHYWHEASIVSPWDFQIRFYQSWSGRYFATAAISLFPYLGDPFSGYKIIPISLLFGLFLSLFLLIKSLTQNFKISNYKILIATLVIFSIYLNNMPTTAEGFYWLSGAATYMLGSILLIFLLSLLLRSERILNGKNTPLKILCTLAAIGMTIAIVGSSEVLAVQFVFIALLGTIVTGISKNSSVYLWLSVLIFALLFSLVSFLAPGNFVRQDEIDMSARRSLFIYGLAAASYSLQYLNLWTSNLTLLVVTFLILPIALSFSRHCHFLNRFPNKVQGATLYFVFWISVIFSSLFLTAALKRLPVPDRALNPSYLLFLLGWFAGIFVIAELVVNSSRFPPFPKTIENGLRVILIVALLSQVNFIQSLNDLLRVPRYQAQVTERYGLIKSALARNERVVRLPAFTHPPKTIFNPDLSENPNDYMNRWMSEFFGLNSIVLIDNNFKE